MAEELVKENVEEKTGSWLDKLEEELTWAQPPKETKYEQLDRPANSPERAYEAPRNLISGRLRRDYS